jgi:argininosuccinate lyase
MQEDKEPLFDTIDTVKGSLKIFADMIREMRVNSVSMRRAAGLGFSTATDVADYLVRKGLPFRDAHEAVGKAVAYCVENEMDITELSLVEWQLFSGRIEDDIFGCITVEASVNARAVVGGTARTSVEYEIQRVREGK